MIAFVFSLASCGKGDDPIPGDKAAPLVEFTNIEENQILRGVALLKFEAMDDSGITSLELYIDNKLIKKFSSPPFEYDWNTESFAEGVHAIKIVAKSSAGTKGEGEIKVIVQNALISIDVPQGHIRKSGERICRKFIVLSDENGDLITYGELEDNSTFQLFAPSFKGETFYLSEVSYVNVDEVGGFKWTDSEVYVFPEVTRGKWFLMSDPIEETFQNLANLSFTNANKDVWHILSTNANYTYAQPQTEEFSQSLAINTSSSKLYLLLDESNSTPKYQIVPSVVIGNNPVIDLSKGWKKPNAVTRQLPGDVIIGELELKGFTDTQNTDSFYLGYGDYSENDNAITAYVPNDEFASYQYTFYCTFDNGGLTKTSPSFNTTLQPVLEIPKVDMLENGFISTFNGNMDLVTIGFFDKGASWEFYLPNGTTAIVAPKMPQAVLEWMDGTQQFNFSQPMWYLLEEMSFADSYSDLINKSREKGGLWKLAPNDESTSFLSYFQEERGRSREPKFALKRGHTKWSVRR